jgi:hypothetical protein
MYIKMQFIILLGDFILKGFKEAQTKFISELMKILKILIGLDLITISIT